jgi:O-antigen/teichoic acid export membrane protein
LTVIILIWNNINFNVMSWLGLVKEKNKIIWFTAFVDIVLNLILIPKIGLIGALISTVVCWILMFIYSSKYVWVFDKISKDQFLFWFKNLIWALLFFGIIYFLKENIFVLENWKRLIDIRHFLFIAIIWTMGFVLINLREFLLLKEKFLEVVFTKKWE